MTDRRPVTFRCTCSHLMIEHQPTRIPSLPDILYKGCRIEGCYCLKYQPQEIIAGTEKLWR